MVALPGKIIDGVLDGLKEIFVPDTEYIDKSFNAFMEELHMKFQFDTDWFEGLFAGEKVVEDVYVNYSIPGVGEFCLKIFDAQYLIDGVVFFRPLLRGFTVLMLALYNIRQLIGFFGYNAGVVAGRNEKIEKAREG